MNILLTCAGRRTYLVQYFQAALAGCGEVLACDSSGNAPALAEADRALVVPPLDHASYFDVLHSLCAEHNVRLLVPVHDLELEALAGRARQFHEIGTIPLVSSAQVNATCQDKWAAYQFMQTCGLPTPATFRTISDVRRAMARGDVRFPLLVKPRWGVSSLGIERIDNEGELTLAHEWAQVQLRRTILARLCRSRPEDAFVFQEFLHGEEHGMDVVNDLDGRYAATLARRKLVMRAGNTDRAVTVGAPELERLGSAIGERLRHTGALDCDVMVTDQGCFVLDLNPRFGGGYPFSHAAGADVPAALIAWANGEEPDPAWLRSRPGVTSAKYDGVTTIDATASIAETHPDLELVR